MPRKLWKVRLACPNSFCEGHQLTSAGIYPRVRQVLDIDGYYNLAAEYLECGRCKGKLISWSGAITRQLDVGHRGRFPVLLTYRYACDLRVAILMRQRGLGNSVTQIRKKLVEERTVAWHVRVNSYMTDCVTIMDAAAKNSLVVPKPTDPPAMPELPRAGWLLKVFSNDVITRLDEVKASITSVFGNILKMDSTKKVVKKLGGHSARTASWATNIGNEYGQVLMSVLTASEGYGIEPMVKGIVRRYKDAGVTPPHTLYVDRDCCGKKSAMRSMFKEWPDLKIRLDVWHFMRRFAAGVTSDSHPLYGLFMSRLSACIFEWSAEDIKRLKQAKRAELLEQKIRVPSDYDVCDRITRNELALHCRRRTRGVEETTHLIDELLEALSSDQGRDTLGVPLLDADRIWDIWASQKRHMACIQDPEGISLYTETGKLRKGGIVLPVLRCARGSTSLESFHLHLNRFIPGTTASGMHFQAYLLEGLSRWNEDRANAAVEMDVSPYSTSRELYSGPLKAATNDLSHSVFGKPIHPSYCAPRQYTGELIGIEYLYSQTGEALQDLTLDPDSEEARDLEDFSDDEDEGYDKPDSAANDKTLSTYDLEPRTRKSSIKRRLFKNPDSAAVTSNRQASLTDEGTGGETPTFHDSPKVN
ncbi:uncharacterized protein [Palaemon carinicauda]|uniref:uncharacterized protein n=1 Tax=Palaemon carinicauda TaxID=392227 RepID=UPI0035B609DD